MKVIVYILFLLWAISLMFSAASTAYYAFAEPEQLVTTIRTALSTRPGATALLPKITTQLPMIGALFGISAVFQLFFIILSLLSSSVRSLSLTVSIVIGILGQLAFISTIVGLVAG